MSTDLGIDPEEEAALAKALAQAVAGANAASALSAALSLVRAIITENIPTRARPIAIAMLVDAANKSMVACGIDADQVGDVLERLFSTRH